MARPTSRTSISKTSADAATTAADNRKNCTGGMVPQISPSVPATKLPNALVNIHTPMSIVANLAGASFDTIDRPTGDRHNSPSVAKMYVQNSHHGLTRY